jgi:hypothetical protein
MSIILLAALFIVYTTTLLGTVTKGSMSLAHIFQNVPWRCALRAIRPIISRLSLLGILVERDYPRCEKVAGWCAGCEAG